MQYLLMCCFDEQRWDALPAVQRDQIMRRYGELVEGWIAAGCYVTGGKLEPSSSATPVRGRNGKPAITDGPFAETKEQLGGYHLLECANLDDALSMAARIPTLEAGGTVEIRPLHARLGRTAATTP
jgi:hypothetical protein